ncbi:hypothetical protein [Aphanothece sacrum]|uniref:Transposase n=1 Tax=Aphanothece sacrum FPU1 TaxID=1920663 RepID=A0A401IEL3_APHSA|nr:hypothetical protein [Aphanothece sacrum]GBF79671.1 transposase [Aphanothece sacrum FPU1]GBF87131.1 transposase [Aphanothece sacrum FPU3]
MTALRDYSPTSPPSRLRKSAKTTGRSQSSSLSRATITQLPNRCGQLPLALQFLLLVQKSSTVVTFGLIGLTLGVYGWTVYAPNLWSKQFTKLETLQGHERRLVTTNETLKHKLAEQAEQAGSGLTAPQPSQSIFLPQTPNIPIAVPPVTTSTEGEPLVGKAPVAY